LAPACDLNHRRTGVVKSILAVVICLIAAFAITRLQEWEEWSNAALGLWTAAAPWILGFAGTMVAMWTHVLVGLAVLGLAAVELWLIHGSSPSKTA